MHSDQVKPCPFCGEIPTLPSGQGQVYYIECNCGIPVAGASISGGKTIVERSTEPYINQRWPEDWIEAAKQEAIKRWNSRATGTCNWHQEDDEYGSYETDCGQAFVLNEGTPEENGFKHCCYCSKLLVGHPFQEECNHQWQFIRDWGGNPDIPNGTFDASKYYCPECDTETTERPDGFEESFEEPDEPEYDQRCEP